MVSDMPLEGAYGWSGFGKGPTEHGDVGIYGSVCPCLGRTDADDEHHYDHLASAALAAIIVCHLDLLERGTAVYLNLAPLDPKHALTVQRLAARSLFSDYLKCQAI